ncbi:restriction endonuclease subunit S [Prevotella sp. MA2016]|uniref:restriction endonuclease subunit S n=1 Tax=Prevotella sp. MA2016 TaxID=1408310 RepID=UPI000686EE31|nr:restriction endonuclease subunit S [Prevotella sp. MA2016]
MRKPITIGDLGTIITGKTPPTTNKNYYGDYAVFIKPTDISEQCKFTYETEEMYSKLAAEKYESSLIPKGAICVPCIGTIGTKMTMAPCDCYTNQSINSIVCNDRYDNEYVYYLIKNFLPGLKSYNLGTASGREYVSKSNFEKIELVAEQDKTIQKKIGEFLSRYDSLIENYRKQIKLLEEAAQRLYKEWFVDLHFPGHENTKIVDGVPGEWEKKKLVEIAELKAGGDKPEIVSAKRTNECSVPIFSNGTTNEGLYGYTNLPVILEQSVTISARGSVGYTVFRRTPFVPIVRLISVTPHNIYVGYIFYCLKSTTLDSNGAAQQQITIPMIRNKEIMIPSKGILELFESQTEPIFNQIDILKELIRLLTEARDRLLPKLMSGEIKVS